VPITKSIKPTITKKNLYSVKYLTGVKCPIIPKTPMITAITHKIRVGADSFINGVTVIPAFYNAASSFRNGIAVINR
jgi:hypothetical protein